MQHVYKSYPNRQIKDNPQLRSIHVSMRSFITTNPKIVHMHIHKTKTGSKTVCPNALNSVRENTLYSSRLIVIKPRWNDRRRPVVAAKCIVGPPSVPLNTYARVLKTNFVWISSALNSVFEFIYFIFGYYFSVLLLRRFFCDAYVLV